MNNKINVDKSSTMKDKSIKIFIAAHYNLNNGDKAVLEATIEKIKNISPNADITVSAFAPDKFNLKNVEVVPWAITSKLFFWIFAEKAKKGGVSSVYKVFNKIVNNKYLKSLTKADIVLVSGGHHLTDILSDNSFYKLASNFLIPLFYHKRVYLLPQSIGPVNDKDHKREIVKYIINNSKKVAYRDENSREFLNSLNINLQNTCFVPDMVFGIDASQKNKIEEKTIGVALYCSYSKENMEKKYPFVIENLFVTLEEFISRGYHIHFISMDINDQKPAEDMISKLKARHKDAEVIIEKPASDDIKDTIKLFSGKDLILAYKTHSVVFSIINHTPLVAIAYHPKSIDFMNMVGIGEFAVNDVDATFEKLLTLSEKALLNKKKLIQIEIDGTIRLDKEITDFLREVVELNGE